MALQLQAPTDRPDLSPERNFCRPPSSQPASSQASRIETPTNQQPPQPSAHSWSVPAPQHLARFASLLPSFRSALYPRFGLSPGNQSVLETCLGAPRGIPSPPRCVQPACRQAHHLRTWEEIDASCRRSFLPQGQKNKETPLQLPNCANRHADFVLSCHQAAQFRLFPRCRCETLGSGWWSATCWDRPRPPPPATGAVSSPSHIPVLPHLLAPRLGGRVSTPNARRP